jgi:hypothetical protein
MTTLRSTLVTLLLLTGLAGTAASTKAAQPTPQEEHCTVRIDPLLPGQASSNVYGYRCFATFAEAIFDATGGRVSLDPAVGSMALSGDVLAQDLADAAAGETVIGIDYANGAYQGSSLVWSTSNVVGCRDGARFRANSMPGGWNDRVSSALSYQYCWNYFHYEHANFGGAFANCDCYGMGSMNDKTSSERWQRYA